MQNQFNPEIYSLLVRTHDELEDGAFAKLAPAFENVSERCKKDNITNLIKDCTAAEEAGIPVLIKSFHELMDSMQEYIDRNKALYDALGVDAQ